MTLPKDDEKPRYMNLEGKTQFEMAQAIEAAMAQAEISTAHLSHEMALQWWYEQLEMQVQDEFESSTKPLPSGTLFAQEPFIQQCIRLFDWVMTAQADHPDEVLAKMEALLENSLLDAIDMMKAKKLWQFDVQRKMLSLQGRVIHEFRHFNSKP